MDETPQDRDWSNRPKDPPVMSGFERDVLASLKAVFHRPPWEVFKTRNGGRNEIELAWMYEYWVETMRRTALIIKTIGPDTILDNLDARMKDAYATFSLIRELDRHRKMMPSPARILVFSDEVWNWMPHDLYLSYDWAFELLGCRMIPASEIPELTDVREALGNKFGV